VLGAVGLALLLMSFFLYPRTTELPSPAFPLGGGGARHPGGDYRLRVAQVSPGVAEIKISVSLPTGTPTPPANGVNASAAIPEVLYGGLGQPILVVSYQLRSASSYDWSASPTGAVSSTTAGWQQDLASGDTPGRTAVGVNHSARTDHDIKIFIAGALLGVAGGAVIGAVQETMHLRD
jgi:hypothetical protein